MTFNSLEFVAFAVAIFSIVGRLSKFTQNVNLRNIALLLASYFFYGLFNVGFLIILLFVTLVNYASPFLMHKYAEHRKSILWTTITLSLLPLLTYKYSIFIIDSLLGLPELIDSWNLTKRLLLPVGISFYTFQALSYPIDYYRGKIAIRKNFIDVALFVSFFPTVLSGPIERARNLLPQIESKHNIDWDAVKDGLTTFTWGVFKKVVIADRLADYVAYAYGTASIQSSGTLALAAVLYSIQIYCDFSGYSDMALGVARALGFNLMQNFRFPYFSTSFKSFWRKWHISLTSWFTEYVYFSLGGNRVRLKTRWVFNIAMVFILSGIWHGAAWTFLIWGAMHAVLYLAEHFLGLGKKEYSSWWSKLLSGLIVFIFVTLAWIFFRAENWEQASTIVSRIFTTGDWSVSPTGSAFTFAVNMALLLVFVAFEWKFYRDSAAGTDTSVVSPPRGALWFAAIILMIGLFGSSTDKFIYFQF